MVSNAPNSSSYMNSHMYDFTDLRTPYRNVPCGVRINSNNYRKDCYCKNSIMDIIDKNPDFTRFRYIINLAQLNKIFDDIQANFTVFVPSDRALSVIPEGVFTNMDISVARQIVNASTLNYRMTYDLLSDSPFSYFTTMNDVQKLFITNIDSVTNINETVTLIYADIQATNGIIHVTDDIIWPYFL